MDENKPALVALRDRREQVIQALTDGFANDLLEVDAFEERLQRAHNATTVAELDAIVADLAPLPREARRTQLAPLEADTALAPAGDVAPKKVSAIFSSVERRGAWVVPKRLKASAVFGSVELDFREARFQPGVTELEVRAVFGALEILVPPQLAVECEGSAVLASWEGQGASAVADPDRPLLRITGSAVLGSVEVLTRLPGENGRDARRRQRRERKALRHAERRGLPPPALPPRRE